MDAPVNLQALAPEALNEACMLVSSLSVNTPASELKDDLKKWWTEFGKGILWGSPHPPEEEEVEDEEEGEMPVDQQEATDLQNACAASEKNLLIEKELAQMKADPAYAVPEDDVNELDENFEDDPCLKPDQDTSQRWDVTLDVFTLTDVLKEHNLLPTASNLSAVGESNKEEWKMMKKSRVLLRTTQRLVVFVRLNEGILKPPSIIGLKRVVSPHNYWQHQLALAKTAFQSFATNQPRQALWAGYSGY